MLWRHSSSPIRGVHLRQESGSFQQPCEWTILEVAPLTTVKPSHEIEAPGDILTTAPRETLSQTHPAKQPKVLTDRNCQMINVCPFKPVIWGVIGNCYNITSFFREDPIYPIHSLAWKWKSLSCVWLFCDPMEVHGILQARILEWVASPFSRGSSQPRNWTRVSCIAGRFFTSWATGKPKNTGGGHLSLLQEIFLTQESNQGLPHCRRILYQLSHQEVPSLAYMLWNCQCLTILITKNNGSFHVVQSLQWVRDGLKGLDKHQPVYGVMHSVPIKTAEWLCFWKPVPCKRNILPDHLPALDPRASRRTSEVLPTTLSLSLSHGAVLYKPPSSTKLQALKKK